MSTRLRTLLISVVAFLAIVWLLTRIIPGVAGPIKTLAALKGMITDQGEVLVTAQDLAENLKQAETLNTQNSTALQDQVENLSRQVTALKSEVHRLRDAGGEITSVAETLAHINLGGSDTVFVGDEQDFTRTFSDPWLEATVQRQGDRLTHEYRTRFHLAEFDVEITMPDGTKTHLFNAALVSEVTGDTLQVPVERRVVERQPGQKRLWWRPRPHLRAGGGLGSLWAGGGVSVASWGRGTASELTILHLGEAVILAGDDGVGVGVLPATWNVAREIAFFENLSIGVGWLWTEQSSGLIAVVGAAL